MVMADYAAAGTSGELFMENPEAQLRRQKAGFKPSKPGLGQGPDSYPRGLGRTFSDLAMARCRVLSRRWTRRRARLRRVRQSREPGEEGRDFERHFVAGRQDGDRRCFGHLYAITPGVELQSSAERQGGDLVKLALIEIGCSFHERCETLNLSLAVAETVP